jgi:ankyrin repeat protein
MTALMFASASGHIIMVDFLLTKGAKMIFPDKVRNAFCLQYLLRQKKQVIEYCIAAATYDMTDPGLQ